MADEGHARPSGARSPRTHSGVVSRSVGGLPVGPATPMNAKANFLSIRDPLDPGPALADGFCGLSGGSVNPPIEEHHDKHRRVKRAYCAVNNVSRLLVQHALRVAPLDDLEYFVWILVHWKEANMNNDGACIVNAYLEFC